MTNAIEQAKREMYKSVAHLRGTITINYSIKNTLDSLNIFEGVLEAYLELLRQDHEALHETARARFEDTRKLEAANQDLLERNEVQAGYLTEFKAEIEGFTKRLTKMTEERDAIQLRLHAVDHAYKTQQDRTATPTQDSVDRASCATPDAKTMALLGAVVDVQRIVNDWGLGDLKAKKAMRIVAKYVNNIEIWQAMKDFEKPATCMHSFFAIGDDKMKCTFCGVGK